MTPAGEMREALRAGRLAAQEKRSPANPYNGTGATARERVLTRMWRTGYSAGNLARVDPAG
ncbi:hypothetical protein [Lentzea albidocapillata]|uniref:hypothetical protein n=1 Tax=Lentzea albidocapillata TaxID=40571 RepID=UPI001182C4DB|nr:hypothetical protein [Lentzea albidocapillata]